MAVRRGQKLTLSGSTFPSIALHTPELVQIPSICLFMIIKLEYDFCDADSMGIIPFS